MANEVGDMPGANWIVRGTAAYRRAIAALFCGGLAAFGTEYCVQPIIPLFSEAFGISPAAASLAVSCGTGGMAFAMLIIASLAKRLPRKQVMSAALLISAILAILMALCQSFGLILALRLLQGAVLAGFPAMAIAYVNEEFDAGIVGAVIGIYVGGTSIGGLVGRMLLSLLADLFSWRIALGALGILYAIIGVAFLLALPRPRHRVDTHAPPALWHEFRRLLMNRRLVAVYIIALVVMGAFVCTYNFISYVLLAPPYNLSQTAVGAVYLLYFVGTVASAVMGRLSDRLGSGKVLVISIACMLFGLALSLLAPLAIKLLGLAAFTYGFFGAHCAACGWAGKLDAGDKARISAMYMFFYYIGASFIGTVGGVFLSAGGWDGIVAFLGTVLAAALALGAALLRATSEK